MAIPGTGISSVIGMGQARRSPAGRLRSQPKLLDMTVRSWPLAATLVSPLKRGYAQGVSCSRRLPCTLGKMLKSCKRRRG